MTTTLTIRLHDEHCEFAIGEATHVAPVGVLTLARSIGGDPPRPEDLTNAIGLVLDHLEDATREVPDMALAERVELSGPAVQVVADVEAGATVALPFLLSRVGAEEVFRTLATETRSDRVRNPGLTHDLVHDVLGITAAVVAVLRGLDLDDVWVVAP